MDPCLRRDRVGWLQGFLFSSIPDGPMKGLEVSTSCFLISR